jgi:predicted DNA-binding transcriptional regulator YafY
MPKNKNAFIRYRMIDAAIRNKQKPYPSKAELIDACSGLGSVSARTIDKDIYDMKFDEELGYFAPIEFDRKSKGYYYADADYSINKIPLKQEDLYAMEFACSILRQFDEIDTVKQFMESVGKIEDFISMQRTLDNRVWASIIQTEMPVSYKGGKYLSALLRCIKEQKEVLLHYQRFQDQQPKVHAFHPYVLKEYRNRWYVVGWSEQSRRITIFALERIVDIIQTTTRFAPRSDFDAESFFAYSFGISVSQTYEPETVRLKFDVLEGPFIKTMPLHHSQVVLQDDKNAFVISLRVIPSYELKSAIMGFGSKVKVLEPQWLAAEHVETLKAALSQYNP